MKNFINKWLPYMVFMILVQPGLQAWDLHALLTYPIFAAMPEITGRDSVTATTLEAFLLAVEPKLEATLAREEQWARTNMMYYPPLPDGLDFQATGDPADIRQRFSAAIRINPDSKMIPYLQVLPGVNPGDRPRLNPGDITPLNNTAWLNNVTFVVLRPGEQVSPLDVLVTASDEPEMGLDVGLYADNGTAAGDRYGLGAQPFGNPNLEYGSQSPIHMGLYHEAPLVKKLAPFLRECLPEYRIHLYKTLAKLAFEQGQDYWGWRFTGWGLHYIADLAQPYHTSALPGVGLGRMLLMNILDMLGLSGMKNDAVQLISNRHTALESFERQLLEKAYLEKDTSYIQFQILSAAVTPPAYTDELPRAVLSKRSHDQAQLLDHNIDDSFPAHLVSDPAFELSGSEEQDQLLMLLSEAGDPEMLEALKKQLNGLLQLVSLYGRSYVLSIVSPE